MMIRILILFVLATAALSHSSLCGQRKKASLDEVRALLAGSSALEQARGAALVLKHKLTAATPDLIRLIKAYPQTAARPGSAFAVEAALDALIQMGAKVVGGGDGAAIADLPLRFHAPIIILLSRIPGLHQHALLNMVKRQPPPRKSTDPAAMAAVCTLLSALRTPGLVSYAYGKLDHTVEVKVTGYRGKPGKDQPPGRKMPPRTVPAGFPEIGFYRLQAMRGVRGSRLVVRGKPNIGYVRVVAGPGKAIEFPKPGIPQPTPHKIAVDSLAKMLGRKSRKVSAMLRREGTVRFRNEAQVEHDIEKIKNTATKGYQALLDLLCKEKLLRTDQARALRPKLRVVRRNLRK